MKSLTTTQVSEMLGVSRSAVTQRLQRGTMPDGCIVAIEGRSWIVGIPRGKKLHREATSKTPGKTSRWVLVDE